MGIGTLLQDLIKEKGSNVNEVSNAAGVSPSTLYSMIKRDSMSTNIQDLYKVAYYLGVSLDYFCDGPKKISPYSGEAMRLAKDYDALDRWGKQAIRELADTELARMQDDSRFFAETDITLAPKVIPLYISPAAVGHAAPVAGEEFEPLTLGPDDPQGADFAVRLQGDSMEPDFPDGSVVFCNHDPMADGDIGVFVIDGESICKQYHYDRMMGMTYLFSLNRKRAESDKLITRSSGQTLTCMGRVITKKRYQIPGM